MLSVGSNFPRSKTLDALLDTFQDARSHTLVGNILPLDGETGRLRASDIKHCSMTGMGSIVFVRHGETYANKHSFLAGISDHKLFNQLTSDGKSQAAAAGECLRSQPIQYDRIVVSPLGRAQETAAIVGEVLSAEYGVTVPTELMPILTEHHCGVLENVPIKSTDEQVSSAASILGFSPRALTQSDTDRHERDKLTRMQQGDMRVGQTNGESIGDVLMRQNLALAAIKDKFPEENIIIVAHSVVGAAMKALVKSVPEKAVDASGQINLFKIMPRHGVPDQLSPVH